MAISEKDVPKKPQVRAGESFRPFVLSKKVLNDGNDEKRRRNLLPTGIYSEVSVVTAKKETPFTVFARHNPLIDADPSKRVVWAETVDTSMNGATLALVDSEGRVGKAVGRQAPYEPEKIIFDLFKIGKETTYFTERLGKEAEIEARVASTSTRANLKVIQ